MIKIKIEPEVETKETPPTDFTPAQLEIIAARLKENAPDGDDIAHNNENQKITAHV